VGLPTHVTVKPEALFSVRHEGERGLEFPIRYKVTCVAEQLSFFKAEGVDSSQRAGRKLRVTEAQLLLDPISERHVTIGMAGAKAPREFPHG
jgi:hypothetical protein